MLNICRLTTSHCDISVIQSPGEGVPVLMLHGNSMCKEMFRNQLYGDIGHRHRLIAMDLPGHGQSADATDPARTYNMVGYADAAVEVLHALGIDRAVWLGWSIGGHIGIEALSRYAEVGALMIIGTPPISRGEASLAAGFLPWEHFHLVGSETFTDEELAVYTRTTCGLGAPAEPFQRAAVQRTDGRARRLMMEAFLAGVGANQRETVETADAPLAVVNGGDEPFVNNDYVRSVDYANLWDGQVHALPGLGHAPFWEAPERFDPLLLRFIDEVAPRFD